MSSPTLKSERTDPGNRGDVQAATAPNPSSPGIVERDCGFIPIPPRLRFNPDKPPQFGYLLNIIFGLASTFTVANLYYCQPILDSILVQLASSFNVSFEAVSRIPTLTQAGYATGLLLISPLGDLVPRRPLLLALVLCSASLSVGLAISNSVIVFEVLSFLVGAVTVTPQVLIPLAADLAPANRRASSISIVMSGLLLGILIARVLAGIIAEFSNWRNAYIFAVGVQYVLLALLYLFLPSYPAKNPEIGYFGILWTMAKYAVTEPVLVQACLLSCAASATFTNFWVTLTFLLDGPPYFYTTLQIGLFGLVGILGVASAPLVGRLIDKMVPWCATLVAVSIMLTFQSVLVGAAGINIGAVIVACFGLDVGRQMQQVSLSTAVFAVDPLARSRMNAVMIVSIFIGQVMGTAVGSKVFLQNGWRAAAGLSLGWMGLQLGVLLLRGPHCKRKTWFGWEGGAGMRKRPSTTEHPFAEEKNSVTTSDEEGTAREIQKDDSDNPHAMSKVEKPQS